MALQTNYSDTIAGAYPGQISDIRPHSLVSRTVEGAAMGFGVVAAQGAGDRSIVAPSGGSPKFAGVTVRSTVERPEDVNQYPVGETAAVMIHGAIHVTAGAAVAAGDEAFFVPATGAITSVATSNIPIPGGVFETSGANGELVVLRLA